MLVDAHCHFDFPCFDGQRETILRDFRARQGIGLVIPGVEAATWSRVQAIATEDPMMRYCLGIHPWFVDQHSEADLERLKSMLTSRPTGCVGLGECGLDRLQGDLAAQQPWFEAQVDLAVELGLPLVIHSVRTHDEVAATLRRRTLTAPVLVHAFSGSPEQARALTEIGCYLGVGGVITYPRASKTRRAVAAVPLERLVLETDAPDMPPEGVPKGDNRPTCLPLIFKALCELRRETEANLRAQLLANVGALYGTSWEMQKS
ncbi:TatD family deoxyribonuclease [Marinobacter halodurans]|uniref:TatD family deoxyribonuclease n=1 Tax=Marinobacter halodurans TaxID=2528979 RepID=A0ABY1ZL45_9GAMM|nr:TatD family hydrolase [Marinobacter halodurans]TBW56274.1 TatD family deoxyribonuclease [Marinobacter halodurans]